MNDTKIPLSKKDIPTHFLNINYFLKKYLGKLPDPPLNSLTKKPVRPEDLEILFPKELISQEVSLTKEIEIPKEVREMYQLYRPSSLIRARRLERKIGTPAKIYFKYEGTNPTGAHKLNTAIPQAFYNKKAGVKRLTTETGAGQWGTALAAACNFFDLECSAYMVKSSYQQKPYRKYLMQLFGAEVIPSPSKKTEIGRNILAKDPNSIGSLGIAISEAIYDALHHKYTKYSLGSVLNFVLLHQTIVGLEAKKQLEITGDYPDIIIGCCGGGSNLAGIAYPFIVDKLMGKGHNLRIVAVETDVCPSLAKGEYRYDHGDSAGLTPLLKMKTMGKDFMPAAIHAGGLRYHGAAPAISLLYQEKFIEAVVYNEREVLKTAVDFTRTEGIISAPESAYAIKAAIDEAIKCREESRSKTILFNLSGHGFLDLQAYADFFDKKLVGDFKRLKNY
jgi:tryptophan synthase beta chain